MALIKICFFFSSLVSLIQTLPADPVSLTPAAVEDSASTTVTYTIDFFLVRKKLESALHAVTAYKEATTSILDPLPNPPTSAENEIRWTLDDMRITAFYAYGKLIFLAVSQLLTLTYTTQTFGWYENAFFHFTSKIGQLIAGFDNSEKVKLQSLLYQIVNQTNQNHYNTKLLLTP